MPASFAANYTIATGINDFGVIVGYYNSGPGGTSEDHRFIDNHGQFSTFDVPGSFYTEINGINDLGQLVGVYGNNMPNGNTGHGFIATPG